ncbi:MAG TPA: threonine ammonia-lyase [Clostridiaceae bacterium]|nr:threonine ammonia-lyase [Clostridiaceae bacterium]
MLTRDMFEEARERLKPVLRKTRLIHSPHFSTLNKMKIYLKPENLQLTGAYKIRGAYYAVSNLSDEEASHGLITASAGNHAQGVALAGQMRNVPVTIVMPEITPLVKVNSTKDYDAKVVLYGNTFDDACAHAQRLAAKHNMTFIHPFDNLSVAAGQGTMVYEILEDLPEVDTILVPIGGGGLATGVATLAKMLKPEVEIIGVEPVGAACMQASLRAGHVVSLRSVDTIADGVAVKRPGETIFPYLQKNIDRIVTVPDEELVGVFLDLLEKHKILVENAGLLTVAAAKHLVPDPQRNVVCILSGGNMDVITLASVVQHGLISRERVFTFSVLLPDRPGELEKIAHLVAELRGNIIRLEHNQFFSINRNSAVELQVTLEAFGHDHKYEIMRALSNSGYQADIVDTTVTY